MIMPKLEGTLTRGAWSDRLEARGLHYEAVLQVSRKGYDVPMDGLFYGSGVEGYVRA